ncbi:hypothetical protein ACFO0J_09275 [Castellaniella hirudinis]|uniref:Uncharacterized protein n=1 Tax=Castellaniella hirudinis TaxID=1144617 RepID=A0ABV8RY95_9BURK
MTSRPRALILTLLIASGLSAGIARADEPACGPIDAVTGQPVTDPPAVAFTGGLDAALAQTCRELATLADDANPPACRVTESGAVDAAGATGASQTHYALYCVGPEAASGACELKGAALFLDQGAGRISRFLMRLDDPGEMDISAPSIGRAGPDTMLELPVSVSGTGAFSDDDVFFFQQDRWTRLDTQCWESDLQKRLPAGLSVDKGVNLNLVGLTAQAWLYRKQDANCCPTGGSVDVNLKRAGDRLVIESLQVDRKARPDG